MVSMCVILSQLNQELWRYGVETNSVHVIVDLHYDLDAGCPKPSLGRLLNMVDISVKYNHNQTEDFKILGKIKTSQTDTQMEKKMDNVLNRISFQTQWPQIKIITTYCYKFHDMYNRHNKLKVQLLCCIY